VLSVLVLTVAFALGLGKPELAVSVMVTGPALASELAGSVTVDSGRLEADAMDVVLAVSSWRRRLWAEAVRAVAARVMSESFILEVVVVVVL
jgi:hypothetical protein